MRFEDYYALAQVTSNKSLSVTDRQTVMLLGLNGELGEVADILKKVIGHGHPQPMDAITFELGDLLWYIVEAAAITRTSLYTTAQHVYTSPLSRVFLLNRAIMRFSTCFDAFYGVESGVVNLDTARLHLMRVFSAFQELCYAFCISFDSVMTTNIAKLKARYPEGFSTEHSLNREETSTNANAHA